MKTPITVQIAGQRFVLRGDEDERATRDMAAYLDARMKELQKHTRTADTQSLAVLAALQITEELFAERRAFADLKRRIRDRGRALLHLVESRARV
ncbi:MAG TPA: cell division protein ZapA [Polyangia bacterium]|jgi:cell division protein ZapA|nr:cell division protein ZapA [Polyangia bacterium]